MGQPHASIEAHRRADAALHRFTSWSSVGQSVEMLGVESYFTAPDAFQTSCTCRGSCRASMAPNVPPRITASDAFKGNPRHHPNWHLWPPSHLAPDSAPEHRPSKPAASTP